MSDNIISEIVLPARDHALEVSWEVVYAVVEPDEEVICSICEEPISSISLKRTFRMDNLRLDPGSSYRHLICSLNPKLATTQYKTVTDYISSFLHEHPEIAVAERLCLRSGNS